jgi:glycosyltransferase involved in cell wall biosynthesis
MKKIVFGITSLGIGGAERVLVDIVNKLKDEYDITIFTLYGNGAFIKEIDKKVKIINLYDEAYENITGLKRKLIPIYVLTCGKSIYKKYIKDKFDVEIAFLEGPITRIFANKGNAKKIVWVHNDISQVFGNGFKAKLKLRLDKKVYSKFENIIFVSEDNKKAFNKLFNKKELEQKEKVIYNYIDSSRIIEKSNKKVGEEYIDKKIPSIITVARLVEQKAIDRLIRVHKQLIDDGIEHNIYVIGDGPEKEKLMAQIKEAKVQDTFKLMGKRENPYPYVKRADYFALLSKFEGYGMVIDEAKILNKNIIITNTAAKEAVKGYSKKIIVENIEEAIYIGLKQVLQKNIVFEESNEDYDNSYLLDEIRNII